MLDRRRAARLLSIALAGLAVAGTSPAPTPPAPTQSIGIRGTIRLTADRPVAIQPIDVMLEAGDLDTMTFAASLGQLPDEGTVALSIEALGDGATAGPAPQAGGATPQPVLRAVTANATFGDPCTGSCPAAFGLVLTWLGAPAGETVDVAWAVTATAQFSRSPASAAPGSVKVVAANAPQVPQTTALSAARSEGSVRLTETDRFRAWTVVLHRAAPSLPRPTAQTIAQARLTTSATQAAGEPYRGAAGKDRREDTRRDPPVQVRFAGVGGLDWRWAGEGPLTFDPFVFCARDQACDQTVTIELAWADGRPDTAYDADWTLDLVTIAVEGTVEPIEATVTPVPDVDLAIAAATGTFEAKGRAAHGKAEFVANGGVALGPGSPWASVGLPVRGLVTASVVAVAGTAVPPDLLFQLFAAGWSGSASALGTSAEVRANEEVTFAFEPNLSCVPGTPQGCQVGGVIGANVASSSRNQAPSDVAYSVEWSLELGAAATDDGTFRIVVDPGAIPSASVRP